MNVFGCILFLSNYFLEKSFIIPSLTEKKLSKMKIKHLYHRLTSVSVYDILIIIGSVRELKNSNIRQNNNFV